QPGCTDREKVALVLMDKAGAAHRSTVVLPDDAAELEGPEHAAAAIIHIATAELRGLLLLQISLADLLVRDQIVKELVAADGAHAAERNAIEMGGHLAVDSCAFLAQRTVSGRGIRQ